MNGVVDPRRRRQLLALAGGWPALAGLAACTGETGPALRIGAQVFPGYEFLFLAQELGTLPRAQVRLVEMPSASASIRALGSGTMEGACLTLDEVVAARERGIPLTAVAVLDLSLGADALIARPGLTTLPDLRGRRVAVERTAVGAVMLQAALAAAGLQLADVRVQPLDYDRHERAFLEPGVDAVVTYEPVKGQLVRAGGQVLFSSARIPGRIMDVLAVREDLLAQRPLAVRAAVQGHFSGREAYLGHRADYVGRLAARMHVDAAAVANAFAELELPDLARNQALFGNQAQELRRAARELMDLMQQAGLLQGGAGSDPLFDGRFL